MKITTKEFKELHEWSNALEQLAQMSKTVGKSLSEVKRIDGLMDGLMTSIEYGNLDKKCTYEKLENHFKEQIEKANDFVRECEYMLGIIKILKNSIDEITECDDKIAACVTAVKEIGELPKDTDLEGLENELGKAIAKYENKMY